MGGRGVILFAFFCFLCSIQVGWTKKAKSYQFSQPVPVMVNHVGPYKNPSETYNYYDLPFCKPPPHIQHRHASLGEKLEGDHYERSVYDVRFQVDIQWQSVCELHLLGSELKTLRKAVKNQYYYNMLIDGLEVDGFVGTMKDIDDSTQAPFIYSHLRFDILYNVDKVIHVSVSGEKEVALPQDDLLLEFSFSVQWHPTDIRYEQRMDYVKHERMFPHELEIHWLSILNSFVLVVLLTGFVVVILLRVLKADYARYTKSRETGDDTEDYGWKLIHGDVFRIPKQISLWCALIGIGSQFCVLFFVGLGMAFGEIITPTLPGGSAYTGVIVLYSLTSSIAGFVSAWLFKELGDGQWAWNVVQAATLFFVPMSVIGVVLNIVASLYGTTQALSLPTLILLLSIYIFVGFPLTVVGGIAGRNLAREYDAPCRVNHFERLVPPAPIYRQAPAQFLVAGFLPFSGIYIELHYLFNSVWGHLSYHLYGILFLVFIILLIVTSSITIALTYFQLSLENHHWWWRSFMSGGATAFFVALYSVFFYTYRSNMSGFLQMTFFFGRMLVVCFTFWVMLGAVGALSSLFFVRRIYAKLD